LFRVIIPLSVPSLVTISLFYAVWHWNSWFDAIIYTNKAGMRPLQVILREIINSSKSEVLDFFAEAPPPLESVKSATILVSTLPILCLYPFLQKYFIKGVMVGGSKG